MWLVECRFRVRRRAARFWSRVYFQLTPLDGEDANTAAVVALVAFFQDNHFGVKLKHVLPITDEIVSVTCQTVQPSKSSCWAALSGALPMNGFWIETCGAASITARIRFLTAEDGGGRSNLQLNASGKLNCRTNEIIEPFRSQLEELATDFVTPRVLPTTQTLVGAVLRSDGTFRQAKYFQVAGKPSMRRTRQER